MDDPRKNPGDSGRSDSGDFEIELEPDELGKKKQAEQSGKSASTADAAETASVIAAATAAQAKTGRAPSSVFRPAAIQPAPKPVKQPVRHKKRGERWFAAFVFMLLRFLIITCALSAIIAYIGYKSLDRVIAGREVQLPNVAGLELQTALVQLRAVGLALELDGEEYHDYLKAGKIIRQYPRPGTTVKARSPVRVTVSLGSAKRTTPNLTGMNSIDAKIQLRANHLAAGSLAFIQYDSAEKDTVIAQDPPAGTRIAEDSPVRMLVSLGVRRAEYEMPQLAGLRVRQARERLESLRLDWSRVELRGPETAVAAQEGWVAEQQPPAGVRLPEEQEIVLTVSPQQIVNP